MKQRKSRPGAALLCWLLKLVGMHALLPPSSLSRAMGFSIAHKQQDRSSCKSIKAWAVEASETHTGVSVNQTDLKSPRAWLESLPDGAYTVMRCDYIGEQQGKGCGCGWNVWGKAFHLDRMQYMYTLLQQTFDKLCTYYSAKIRICYLPRAFFLVARSSLS
jgi:hypothetical protein